MAEPRAKDTVMAESEITGDKRALRLIMLMSISRPVMKRNRQRPMLATSKRYERDWAGKMCAVKPGIRPMAVGPRTG